MGQIGSESGQRSTASLVDVDDGCLTTDPSLDGDWPPKRAQTMIGHELTAVVMSAGKGSRISELTAGLPKCLVPVANKPMIFYPLEALIKAKFTEVIVVVPDIEEDVINKALNELKLEISYNLVSIPYSRDFGTADSLRLIKDKIKGDLLVMSCDTITDFPIRRLIDSYRIHSPTFLSLISSLVASNETSIPGRKGREKPEKDLIGIDAHNGNRLVFLSSEVDFDDNVSFSVRMLKKCPNFRIRTNLLDAHIYILKKWTLNYLQERSKISSLKGEFLPSLVRKQFRKQVRPAITKTPAHPSVLSMSGLNQRHVFDFIETNDIELGILKLEPSEEELNDETVKQQTPNTYPDSRVKCFAYMFDDGYCVRANTLSGYCEANRILLKQNNSPDKKPPKRENSLNSKSQIDGIVGNVKSIGEKCSIKRSIIGNNCVIGDKVKLTNTIVMDNVTIEEGSNVQGSIVCSQAQIGTNAEVKDCIIAASQNVHSLGKFTNEVIMDIEQMMEL